MKLTNRHEVSVSLRKVVDYLLSETHEDGRHKARFFRHFGFSSEDPEQLVQALKRHALTHSVTKQESSAFGKRFAIEGIMEMPDGRNATVRTIWFLGSGETTPRFVTAYPAEQRKKKE